MVFVQTQQKYSEFDSVEMIYDILLGLDIEDIKEEIFPAVVDFRTQVVKRFVFGILRLHFSVIPDIPYLDLVLINTMDTVDIQFVSGRDLLSFEIVASGRFDENGTPIFQFTCKQHCKVVFMEFLDRIRRIADKRDFRKYRRQFLNSDVEKQKIFTFQKYLHTAKQKMKFKQQIDEEQRRIYCSSLWSSFEEYIALVVNSHSELFDLLDDDNHSKLIMALNLHKCSWCNIMDTFCGQKHMKCAGCDIVWFCSKLCQTKHWRKSHRFICRQWVDDL